MQGTRIQQTISVLLMVALMAVMCVTLWPAATVPTSGPMETGPPITVVGIAPAGGLTDFEQVRVLASGTEVMPAGDAFAVRMEQTRTVQTTAGLQLTSMLLVLTSSAMAIYLVLSKRARSAILTFSNILRDNCRQPGDQLKFPSAAG